MAESGGGFCLFPSFEAVLRPGAEELAVALLKQEWVATVPGVAFGHDAHLRSYVRMWVTA